MKITLEINSTNCSRGSIAAATEYVFNQVRDNLEHYTTAIIPAVLPVKFKIPIQSELRRLVKTAFITFDDE